MKPGAGRHFQDEPSSTPTYHIAIWGLPGYTFKGIYKELQKHLGSSVQNYIVAARTAQGYDEWHTASQEERLGVVGRWQSIQVEIEKEKQLARHGNFHGRHCYLKATIEARKNTLAEKRKKNRNAKGNADEDTIAELHASHPFLNRSQKSQGSDLNHNGTDFEEAIRTSVAATSRGNPEEDQMIERAIRASIEELHLASKEVNHNEAIHRAIQASVSEATNAQNEDHSEIRSDRMNKRGEHERELAAALQRSMDENQKPDTRETLADVTSEDSNVDTDDDENIKAAIERSNSTPPGQTMGTEDGDDFQTAIELSRKAHEEHEQGLCKSKTEEEIVLEYVKKQSLVEEHLKRSIAGDRDQ